jgi:hypothetical protein
MLEEEIEMYATRNSLRRDATDFPKFHVTGAGHGGWWRGGYPAGMSEAKIGVVQLENRFEGDLQYDETVMQHYVWWYVFRNGPDSFTIIEDVASGYRRT